MHALPRAWKTYKLDKGPKFALERVKPATDLTAEMLQKGTWREAEFKAYNFNAMVMRLGGTRGGLGRCIDSWATSVLKPGRLLRG